jgi:hypothetical protein
MLLPYYKLSFSKSERISFQTPSRGRATTNDRKNKHKLQQLSERSDVPVLVTSGSSTFLGKIQDLDNVYTIPGKVVHIDSVTNEKQEVYLKSFVDFFTLSPAQKVYNIGTSIMYRTDFPAYAAKLF